MHFPLLEPALFALHVPFAHSDGLQYVWQFVPRAKLEPQLLWAIMVAAGRGRVARVRSCGVAPDHVGSALTGGPETKAPELPLLFWSAVTGPTPNARDRSATANMRTIIVLLRLFIV